MSVKLVPGELPKPKPTFTVTPPRLNQDVHFWTPAMRAVLKEEFPNLPMQTRAYFPKFDSTVAEIQAQYPNDPQVAGLLAKMKKRKNEIDKDLFDAVPAGMLAFVWIEYIKETDLKECYTFFHDTLVDMGSTCIQGDTHRLFSVLVALQRADQKEEDV